ncbi:MAG: VWA domain-containing protein [Myxococcaceae bacterium]|nr:VWA domain-containing protein [Myxococcaceae bacterium]
MLTPRVIRLLSLLSLLAAPAVKAQGMLIPSDTTLKPLGIKYQRVSAEIKDGTAVTRVEQVFVNDGPRQLEAHYVFPLPKGAALQEFYLWIDGKKTKGEVLEKEKATQIYEGIVRRLQDPGLLEYIDTDAFRARVFPVPAHGEQKIELSFSQVLDFRGGLYAYHYPLGASAKGAPPLQVRQDFTFSAKIASKEALRSIYSPTHKLSVSRQGENGAVVGLELGPGTDISKDLDLYYSVSDKAVGLSLLTHRPNGDEPGYFIALIAPKVELKDSEIVGKRITFVMDTSGSMMGERIKIARDTLKYCVTRLNPKDEFNVIRFSTDVESLFETPKPATPENVQKAVAFSAQLEAVGGTAIDEAMKRALKDGLKSEKPHLVMFITDGQPTVGETDENAIALNAKGANVGKSRVFAFGVGDDLNARLLERLANEGNGTTDFVRDGKDFEVKVSGFFDKVSNPVLADLQLDLGAFTPFDVYPKRLGDLFKGQQLVVMGRYRTPGDGTVVLKGNVNGKPQVFEYRASAASDERKQDFIPRLWAIRKVGFLLDEIRLHGEKAELKGEIVTLGKKFGIVTPYTSYLVVEDKPAVAQNRVDFVPPPPPRPMWPSSSKALSRGSEGAGMAPPAEAAAAPAPEFDSVFGGSGKGAAEKKADLGAADGKDAIRVAQKVKAMKEEERAGVSDDAVRTAGGRTFIWNRAWTDVELPTGGKQLKVKYLSEAYFALLKARPELKAALALGDRVVVLVAAGKSVAIAPDAGETTADAVTAFLK